MDNPFSLDPVDPKRFIDNNNKIKEEIYEILDTLQNKETVIRVAICGNSGAGKSSLIKYFAHCAKRKPLIIYKDEISTSARKEKVWDKIACYCKENCKGKDCKEFLKFSLQPIQYSSKNILYPLMGVVYALMLIFYIMEVGRNYQNYFPMIVIFLSILFAIMIFLMNLDEIKKLIRPTKTGLIMLFETSPFIREDDFINGSMNRFVETIDIFKDIHDSFKSSMENGGFKNMKGFVLCVECKENGSNFGQCLNKRGIYFDCEILAERELDIRDIVESSIKDTKDIKFDGYEELKGEFGSTTKMIRDCIGICHFAYEEAKKYKRGIITGDDVKVGFSVYTSQKTYRV